MAHSPKTPTMSINQRIVCRGIQDRNETYTNHHVV